MSQLAVTAVTDIEEVTNCVVIPEDFVPGMVDIINSARNQGAYLFGSGADRYCVQFAGEAPALFTYTELLERIQQLRKSREEIRVVVQ